MGDDDAGRRRRDLSRRRARSRRGTRRRARDDLRSLRRARATRHGRDRSRSPAPVARARTDRVVAPRRRSGGLGAVGRGRGVVAASRRGIRRGALLHRHAEGIRTDLEAGALGGRFGLGAQRGSDNRSRCDGSAFERSIDITSGRGHRDATWSSCCSLCSQAPSVSRRSCFATVGRARWSTASRSSSADCARSHPNRPRRRRPAE